MPEGEVLRQRQLPQFGEIAPLGRNPAPKPVEIQSKNAKSGQFGNDLRKASAQVVVSEVEPHHPTAFPP